MVAVDVSQFEAIPASELSTGFYADIKRRKDSKKRVILIRTPKNIKAADLAGIKLEMTGNKKSSSSAPFTIQDSRSGMAQIYQISKGVDGELAPVALAVPSNGAISIEKGFDEMWQLGLMPELPREARLEVDLEDDIGGRSWRQVPQATNLRVPISAVDIPMSKETISLSKDEQVKPQSPVKKSKKRKNESS